MPDNSAASTVENYQPEEVISYTDWLKTNDSIPFLKGDQSFWSKVFGFFSGRDEVNRSNYEAYLNNLNLRNEQKATQSARAYDEYMSNTAYQRAFKDLEKAGLNPYLLVQGSGFGGASSSSLGKPSYRSQSGINAAEGNPSIRDLALLISSIGSLIKLGSSAKGVGESRKDVYYHFVR